MKLNYKKQAGFGALEVMIALMVGALVIIGAVAWYQTLTTSQNNSNELSNLSSITTNVRQLRTISGYGASGSNLVPVLINAGGIPDNMTIVSGVVYSSFGGSVTVTSTGLGFTITYAGLPAENCIFLATKGASSNTTQTNINGGGMITGEVSAMAANTGCSTASNSVAWTAR